MKLLKVTVILFIVFGFTSCKKKKYCAECYEYNSGYYATDFCGETDEVDDYMSELTTQGYSAGQAWSCSKSEE